ncbi:hypothetical protein AcV5_006900 [Taiwanofungus camphoratus]|nr:hypothetical protein AcV7_007127 [Antrodia cinnamomea]KAI0930106.1 hypothetical protein AcV5_006900 [Antrodia cinnamomea]
MARSYFTAFGSALRSRARTAPEFFPLRASSFYHPNTFSYCYLVGLCFKTLNDFNAITPPFPGPNHSSATGSTMHVLSSGNTPMYDPDEFCASSCKASALFVHEIPSRLHTHTRILTSCGAPGRSREHSLSPATASLVQKVSICPRNPNRVLGARAASSAICPPLVGNGVARCHLHSQMNPDHLPSSLLNAFALHGRLLTRVSPHVGTSTVARTQSEEPVTSRARHERMIPITLRFRPVVCIDLPFDRCSTGLYPEMQTCGVNRCTDKRMICAHDCTKPSIYLSFNQLEDL